MKSFFNDFFKRYYKNMSTILFNKFENEQRVIRMYLQNRTTIDIAKEVHMSFRDISQIIKTYQRKKNCKVKEKKIIKMVK